MKVISILYVLFYLINIYVIEGKYWDYSDNGENSIVIERKNNEKENCISYSIYKDDILIKSNIPIINGKINLGNIDINQSRLSLKCDNRIKQKREEIDIMDLPSKSKRDSYSESSIESDEEYDSDIDAIDNTFVPSDKGVNNESVNTLNKNTIPTDKSNKCNSNKKNKSSNNEDNNNEQHNINGNVVSNQDNVVESNYRNKANDSNNQKQEDNESQNNNNNIKNDKDNKNVNEEYDKQKNDSNDTKNDDQNIDNNKDIDSGTNKDKDKPEKETKDDEEENANKVHLGIGLSLSFLLTGGMFLSVLKFRKMSYRQLEDNAQEISANSIYIPSPMLSNSSSVLSMSHLEYGSNSHIFDSSIGSISNSFIS